MLEFQRHGMAFESIGRHTMINNPTVKHRNVDNSS